jgi:hypothetical protein
MFAMKDAFDGFSIQAAMMRLRYRGDLIADERSEKWRTRM